MAEGKKSFILYSDLLQTAKKLPKEKAGELFLTILEYVNDLNPDPEDVLIQIAFEPIKMQLKRDLEKWETQLEQRSRAGKMSAEKRASTKVNESQQPSTTVESRSTNPTDNVTVNDTVTVSDINTKVFNKGFFLSELPKDLKLNEMQIGATVEFIRLQTKKIITDVDIGDEWESFKIDNFGKKEWRSTFEDVLSHFRRTLRIKINNGTNQQSVTAGKSGNSKGANQLLASFKSDIS